ncbi:hypothetical protein LILAB_25660 [Corallococcus macrosporus]|uniref:Uncharacterized protein n=1 Tax=Myxococcus fulvus (strain ATCC BAA-855 / HW-1) TaxID=483219 RepID=F8C9C5_MYXFH|nr:hypothetical protein LILAB_25660 [Corallococcus macrosporus]
MRQQKQQHLLQPAVADISGDRLLRKIQGKLHSSQAAGDGEEFQRTADDLRHIHAEYVRQIHQRQARGAARRGDQELLRGPRPFHSVHDSTHPSHLPLAVLRKL